MQATASDVSLQVHHAEIQTLKPKLLALNFVIASLAKGSRIQGFKNDSAPVQFQYRYLQLAPDCGGEFLVWWYQNMPGYNSGQTYSDGRPMPSVWPYFFY
jgi:hypothetical protein